MTTKNLQSSTKINSRSKVIHIIAIAVTLSIFLVSMTIYAFAWFSKDSGYEGADNDIRQVQAALETYFDYQGQYPLYIDAISIPQSVQDNLDKSGHFYRYGAITQAQYEGLDSTLSPEGKRNVCAYTLILQKPGYFGISGDNITINTVKSSKCL